ncbi:MAG TPA: hypothetical protein VI731_04645, partial [Bacteroidia bacterium]|nr:hypothetical protein [Bacteroidia bacterium]
NVVVFPAEDMIILKKDRNFSFEGSIMAGRFDYYGKLFSFDYSTFSFNLTNVDSVRIWVDSPQRDPSDPKGGFVQMKVRSVIENLNGKLEVDFPGNRSGIWSKKYPQYPVFTSAKPAFVYYDKKTIQRGVYVRDQFYFKMDPFTIDSLDNFQSNSMRFTGILASAGIFPDMRDTLRLMSDYSLGFTRKTPPEGYQIYGGKAKFTNMIRLSNAGLHGNGPLDYITSTALSNDFIFYPDSTNGVASSYVIREQNIPGRTEYPQVNVSNAYIHYMPKRDFMNSTNRDSLFTVYTGSKATFGGTMSLSPKNLAGNGKLSFSSAELISNKMVLAVNTSDADTASFRLKALELARISFSTDNVKAHIDLDLREGEFKANGEGTIVTFDVNQYICFMDNFKWYMDKEEIELNGAENTRSGDKIDLTGPEFISIHPKQDSLRFNAPRALYNHREHIIYARGVQEILVADARIVPDSGYVVLERNAYMRTLTNSQITANTVTNYHHVFNCVTDIYSRHNYVSTGDYAFIDELKKEQIIHFAKITPDSSGQTYAEGLITDSMQFNLSPAFDYRGRVVLAANNQFLVFEGTTGLMHNCAFGNSRLFFKGEINPAEIYIPVVNSPVNDKQEPITTGIVSTVSVDSTHIYGSFLSPKKGKTDVNIVNADVFLFYEKSSREYRISNRQKLVERSLPGNYVSVSTKNCIVYGEGKMTMHGNLGKVFINPIGNSTHNTVNHTTKFDLIMGIDFYFNDKLMDILIEDINASASLTGTDPGRPTYQRALAEMVGKERADKLIAEITIKGEYKKFPDELRYTFFFTDVQMAWNQATRAYISSGLLGLQSIGKEMINKYIPGTIMLERKKGQDILTIYFDLENGKWYTFVYINGSMAVYSTNTKFMEDFKAIKDDDKS